MPQHLAPMALIFDRIWAIEPGAGSLLLEQLRKEDRAVHAAQYQAHLDRLEAYRSGGYDRDEEKPFDFLDGIAVIPIAGVMMKRESSYGDNCSTLRARRMLRAARNDEDVRGVLLQVDSPGGSVSGTGELADEISALAATKTTWAHIEGQCCSAAMWAASQCGRVIATRTSLVGSLGTMMVAYDASRMAEEEGVEVLVFSTGPHKGAGVFGSKVTEEQRAEFQRVVDDLNTDFKRAVSSGRRLADARVADLFTGQVWKAPDALGLGLIDGVMSVDQAVSEMRAVIPPPRDPSARAQAAVEVAAQSNSTQAETTAPDPLAELRRLVTATEATEASPTAQ